ncbi:MAG: hypothetical protein OXU63_10115 [Acidobacteriota bacterium]|nr:hypothetical protein [Acidobacteriota bacterium]
MSGDIAAPGKHGEGGQHRRRAEQPEFLADDREDEVGTRERQEVELLGAFAQTLAGQTARSDRDPGLQHLEAVSGGIVLG